VCGTSERSAIGRRPGEASQVVRREHARPDERVVQQPGGLLVCLFASRRCGSVWAWCSAY
jgi:hypothetical protein